MQKSHESRRLVHVSGAVAFASYMAMALLSWVQTPALWHESVVPRTKEFFATLAAAVQPTFPFASGWLLENRLFGGPGAVIATYWATLAIATAAAAWLVFVIARRHDEPDPEMPALLLRWSAAFTAVCILSFPVFTQDFWLSVVWGRMITAGHNPYYSVFTSEALSGLPLDHFPMPMSYGPLWGLVSAAVCYIAGGSILAVAVLFKVLLAAAWVGSLYLVDRIMMHEPVRQRCLAMVIFGWLPCGVTQTVAEGHNDVAMVVFVLLWLYLLLKGRIAAPIALAASVLCKYVTAPLLLVDLIFFVRSERGPCSRYALRLLAPALLGLAVGAIFYRSLAFFDGVLLVGAWRFLQPQDALRVLELTLGIPSAALGIAAAGVIPVTAFYQTAIAWKKPTRENTLKLTVAVVSTILFVAASHVWPWYIVWALAPAALVPTWWLSRFVIGIAIVAPFTVAAWWIEPFEHHIEVAALAMYAAAIVWAWVTRRGAGVIPQSAREIGHAGVSASRTEAVAGG
ncbi:MAG: hypothetical protein ACKVP3_07095 [Hyphomicrobiaceae bacterium]